MEHGHVEVSEIERKRRNPSVKMTEYLMFTILARSEDYWVDG